MNKNKLMSAAALLASVVSTNVLASEKEMTLMLDWFVNPNHGPIVIAKERGYFKEQGLKVNIQEPAIQVHHLSWSRRVKSTWRFHTNRA